VPVRRTSRASDVMPSEMVLNRQGRQGHKTKTRAIEREALVSERATLLAFFAVPAADMTVL
jgi:hypothetical protein